MTAKEFYIQDLKENGFTDDKIKELTEHKDLPWLMFADKFNNFKTTNLKEAFDKLYDLAWDNVTDNEDYTRILKIRDNL